MGSRPVKNTGVSYETAKRMNTLWEQGISTGSLKVRFGLTPSVIRTAINKLRKELGLPMISMSEKPIANDSSLVPSHRRKTPRGKL